MKEKRDVGPLYFGVFPSDHVPTTRDVNVHFFPHAVVPVNYTANSRNIFKLPHIQGVSQLVDITAGGNFPGLCDQKSLYKHVSDFGRL
jgi:hypothetical protein